MKINRLNLPVSFSTTDFDHDRFLKVRVKVMHTGLNLNGSNFGMEAVNKAAPTISNIPLLAFVQKEDGVDGSDFAGHEYEIKITKNGTKFVYLGRPIGMIPETNNYAIETDEDGKTFVTVDGYIWKDYANEALDIVMDSTSKRVSMEIAVKDYSYDDGYADILDYSYTGIALLGDNVQEAMIGAKAEVVNYSANSIATMMQELKEAMTTFSAIEPEVESIVEPATELEVEPEVEMAAELEIELENEALEEPEVEMSAEIEIEAEIPLEVESEIEMAAEVEIEDSKENSKTDDALFTIPMTEHESLKAEFELLKQENETLKAKVLKYEQEAKTTQLEQLYSEFEDVQSLEEFEAVKLSAETETLELTELKLFALRGKYNTNSDKAIAVFNHTNTNEPSWLSLVKQNLNK